MLLSGVNKIDHFNSHLYSSFEGGFEGELKETRKRHFHQHREGDDDTEPAMELSVLDT